MRRRILSLLLILISTFGLLATPAYAAFDDVPENMWCAEAVDYVYINCLFQGVGGNSFAPSTTMSRGMFVTALHRMSRETSAEYPSTGFPDVPEDAWYTAATNWAVATGLVNGTDQGTFCPDDPVTREQICKMVALYCDYIGFTLPDTVVPGDFPDSDTISDYALPFVDVCLRAGLVQGCTNGLLKPTGSASRAEVATILHRLCLLLTDAGCAIGDSNPAADWRLILVNRWNPVPEGYVDTLSLSYIGNNEKFDSRAISDYNDLIAAMRADGLSPYVNSGFRTNSYQQYLYNNKIYQYINYGYSWADAELLAQQWVAVPGTSEHEVGLAIDFNMYMSNSTAVHTWLEENAHYYGFIYRYREEKMEATGIQPEAWHYRYVGRENAIRITESGLCLEEYLDLYS